MPQNVSEKFYSKLPVFSGRLIDLLGDESRFETIPEDWNVVITDIKQSTVAMKKGMHQAINLAATATIISALNIAKDHNINFPFFFGGDGATLILPSSITEVVIDALSIHQRNVNQFFGLDLRVDKVAVSEIYERGKTISIAKSKLNRRYVIPVVLGEGLDFADKLIKERTFTLRDKLEESDKLNLSGMECRWDSVKPPEALQEVVCIVATSVDPNKQSMAYKEVLETIERIYGSFNKRRPISVKGLKLLASLPRFKSENQLKFGTSNLWKMMKSIFNYIIGKIYLKFKDDGKDYLESLVEHTDTLVVDGKINTVITGTEQNRIELENELNRLEIEGLISYGLAVCKESIMSCYVQDRKANHIHFVDGSEGGYTRAATVLKKKLRAKVELNK